MNAAHPDAQASDHNFISDFTRVFLASLAIYFCSYIMLNIFSFDWGHHDRHRYWLLGLLTLVSILIGLVVRPLVGRLSDLHGGKELMLGGAVLLLLDMLIFHWAHGVPALFIARTLLCVGGAMFGTAASALIALIVPARWRGMLIGLYFGVTYAAIAIFFCLWDSEHLRHYENAFSLVLSQLDMPAAVKLLLAIIGLPLLVSAAAAGMAINEIARVGDRRAAARAPATGLQEFMPVAAVFPALVAGISTFAYSSIFDFLPSYSWEYELGDFRLFFAVLAVTLAFTCGLLGWLSDRIGRGLVVAPGLLLSAAAVALLALWPSRGVLLSAAAIGGVGIASVLPVLMAMTADRVLPAQRGAAMGVFTFLISLGSLVGAILWPHVWANDAYGFRSMYLLSALACVIAFSVLALGGGLGKTMKNETP